MLWLYVIAVALIGVIAVVLTGRWDGEPAPREESPVTQDDQVDQMLQRTAGGSISAEDLESVQLDSALRGYRMDQVDKLLAAVTAQLRQNPR